MSSTSQKLRDFIAEPIREKDVNELPGVGPTYATRLTEQGFDKAYVVLGQFLLLKKDEESFVDWFLDICGEKAKRHAKNCYDGLRDWCDSFI